MMGVVGFIDVYSYTVRVIGQLSNCVYDQAIIAFSVVGGYDIESVADAEKCRHIIFVCKIIAFCNIFLAEFIRH